MPVEFCSACGARLPHQPPVRCESCGVRHYRNAKPCAAVLVVDRGRVLYVRRANDPWRGAWGPPGGFCEPDEHPIDAAEREAFEETGLRVRVRAFLGQWLGAYRGTAQPEEEIRLLNSYYLASHDGGDANPDPEEVIELAWRSIGDVPRDLAFPEMNGPALAALAKVDLDRPAQSLLDRPAHGLLDRP